MLFEAYVANEKAAKPYYIENWGENFSCVSCGYAANFVTCACKIRV